MNAASFLSDVDLRALAAAGLPPVSPFDPEDVQPASVDLRLGNRRYDYGFKQHRLGDEVLESDCPVEEFTEYELVASSCAFVSLAETITIPEDMVGFVFARSSVTRLGLLIAPVFMNPGYKGVMPLTISNVSKFPITLLPGIRIAQLILAKLGSKANESYQSSGKYAAENFSVSKLHNDAEIKAALNRVMEGYYPSSRF